MKVTIDMENLETLVQTTMEKNIENIVKEQIEGTVRKVADDLSKKVIADEVSENFQRFVDEYIANTKIKVGGNYWDDTEEQVSFEEYINRQFDFDEMIKKDLDKFMDDISKQVNKTMKETFDNSTKSMLSTAVLNILGANETYRQIENNIKCIADKQV